MKLTDTHTHLYVEEFKDDIDSVVQRALEEGVEKFYLPAIDSSENDALLALEKKFPERMFAMAGLHPCSVKENFKEELEKFFDANDMGFRCMKTVKENNDAVFIYRISSPNKNYDAVNDFLLHHAEVKSFEV